MNTAKATEKTTTTDTGGMTTGLVTSIDGTRSATYGSAGARRWCCCMAAMSRPAATPSSRWR